MAAGRMKRAREFVAGGILVILLAALGIVVAVRRPGALGPILVQARMAETGGWTPENLVAEVGKPLHLRLTSEDVVHGFAVGHGAGMPPGVEQVEIRPGEFSEITLVFDKPGVYTYYCTRWCSLNHWRMRGVIEVTGAAQAGSTPASQPLYAALGLDIDASHPALILPEERPSASRGALNASMLPANLLTRDYYQAHSPTELFQRLRLDPTLEALSEGQVWALVAYVWQANTSSTAVGEGRLLYAQNCAACHGERGGGDGVFAEELSPPNGAEHGTMQTGEMTQAPADFSDPHSMLGASPAVLHGKILRGGMGSGMPYWGPILTDQQIWALVAYLYTFQFDP